MSPRPDWYIDPTDGSRGRYWDGDQWTQHLTAIPPGHTLPSFPVPIRQPTGGPASPSTPPPPTEPAAATTTAAWPTRSPAPTSWRARTIGLAALGVLIVLGVVATLVYRARSDSYDQASDIAAAIADAGVGCTPLSSKAVPPSTEGVTSVDGCLSNGSYIDMFVTVDVAARKRTLAQLHASQACVNAARAKSNIWVISDDRWAVTTLNGPVARKVHDAIGGSLANAC